MLVCSLYTITLSSLVRWSLLSDYFNSVKGMSTELALDRYLIGIGVLRVGAVI
jgi:hypothetical protein